MVHLIGVRKVFHVVAAERRALHFPRDVPRIGRVPRAAHALLRHVEHFAGRQLWVRSLGGGGEEGGTEEERR